MIKIISIEHESAELIELQYRSFKKNMLEDFEFILIDNAQITGNTRVSSDFSKLAERCQLTHIPVEFDESLVEEFDTCEDSVIRKFKVFSGSNYSTGAIANSYALQWTQKNLIAKSSDPICLIHSDIFMIRPDNLSQYLTESDVIYYPQGPAEVNYIWPFFVLLSSTAPNRDSIKWWCGSVNNTPVDCGGMSYYFLNSSESLRKNHLHSSYIQDDPNLHFHPSDYEIFSIDSTSPKSMIHYRSASNWNNRSSDYHSAKKHWIQNLVHNGSQ